MIVSLVIAMWALLALSVVLVVAQCGRHRAEVIDASRRTPRLVQVRALAFAVPVDPLVDGVSARAGDHVLVWDAADSDGRASVWRLTRKSMWVQTRALRAMVPGSVVQVTEGLAHAHVGFVVHEPGRLVPLWRHWLGVSDPPARGGGGDIGVLQVDADGAGLRVKTLDAVLSDVIQT